MSDRAALYEQTRLLIERSSALRSGLARMRAELRRTKPTPLPGLEELLEPEDAESAPTDGVFSAVGDEPGCA